ncbi:MAG TPA: methylmalonyl-CoA epimerase [bacterium]|jgi:methylmalonyl-CoA/ethylmalonyl-CoA epimerase|nr:methylmalonyl-CoA epimerase [bacterium]HNT64976.1 methylmalonyl-CoA epimerase [bacterium]HOX84384.1 methylmalonyl-CoA epimerase [bacterium]HPG46019.1 methylmalonyl-CoA epimerase [bacterium]HPM97841.1 methylmalonyl-CoA epimerase [bacterium]
MITQINHIGIAVESLEATIPFYRDQLRLPLVGIEEVTDQKVRVAIFRIGEVHIELLEPTDPESPIARFLEKKGQGIHHIALQTDDIEGEIENMRSNQIEMIDVVPRPGAHGNQIAFLHPRSTGKVLTEICQHGEEQAH